MVGLLFSPSLFCYIRKLNHGVFFSFPFLRKGVALLVDCISTSAHIVLIKRTSWSI